jgi:hypothetical protein
MDATSEYPESPEDEGIPSYADDNSSAYDQGTKPRLDDPPSVPPRDRPLGLDEYGVTHLEEELGEPLDVRLRREVPDFGARDRFDVPVDEDQEEEPPPVVGRLVAPDEGIGPDLEAKAVASDTHELEGLSAEEAAMHVISPDEVPLEDEIE